MKKFYSLFVIAAMCCYAMTLNAVPAPSNVHWEGTTLKFELAPLTGDSVYEWFFVTLYTESDEYITGSSGYATDGEYDFSSNMYNGRTYYATLKVSANPGSVQSVLVTSPKYTVPGEKDIEEIPDVTLNANGTVNWGYIGSIYVTVTLQKKNGEDWDNIDSKKTSKGWDQSLSFDAITTPGTYRAVAEAKQGEDVVRRGISEELVVDETFTVTFDAQSLFANPAAASVAKGSQVGAPEIPETNKKQTDGHVFYWSTDTEGAKPWSFSNDVVTKDTTLYAQWKEWLEINPVWDVDTCRWTLAEKDMKLFQYCRVQLFTESDNEIETSSMNVDTSLFLGDIFFSGRKYAFSVTLTDYFGNKVTAKSALRTKEGEVATLPLQNMQVADANSAQITWSGVKSGLYIRSAELKVWNKSTSDWDELATVVDASKNYYTSVCFDKILNAAEYYRIYCKLLQGGEYVVYEGELFYGNSPATGVDNTTAEGKAVKRMVNGQLLIIRDGKTFNALGAEIK